MDLDETPTNEPPPRRGRKGLAMIAALAVVIVLAIFIGYNTYYAATSG